MKSLYKIALAGALVAGMNAQRVVAQEEVIVSSGASLANQVYYSLAEGEQGSNALSAWDIAFDATFFGVGVRVNTAKGIQVAKYPGTIDDWDIVDTTGFWDWEKLYDSRTAWEDGALNSGAAGMDVGWGLYNPQNNHITTGHAIFILRFSDESCKKLKIDSNANQAYYFTYADIDGENEVSDSILKASYAGKNHAYYSLITGEELDLEPATSTWDLIFGRYSDVYGSSGGMNAVSGVRHNKHVTVVQIDGTDPEDVTLGDVEEEDFSSDINIIGDDWKVVNFGTGQWDMVANRSFFVKTATAYYKIYFTAFGGNANGNFHFTKEYLGDVVSVNELNNQSSFFLYPNPVSNSGSSLQVVIETHTPEQIQLNITDLQGRVVMTTAENTSGQLQTITIPNLNLTSGLYHVSVITSKGIATQKLVVR